jgi:hypothetical protein
MDAPAAILYNWREDSTVIREPAFLLENMDAQRKLRSGMPMRWP